MMVNEIFGPTLQGEGPFAGTAVMFVRLWGCVAPFCDFCDTPYTWEAKSKATECHEMSFDEIYEAIRKLTDEISTVVITGGEPCMQKELPELVESLQEGGCTIHIETSGKVKIPEMENTYIICSPKQYNGKFIVDESVYDKANYFKFVIGNQEEMDNVMDFLEDAPGLQIPNDKVYLMPKGETKEKQLKMMKFVAEQAIKYDLKFSGRLHTLIWDTKRKV